MRIGLVTDGIYPYVIGGMQKHSYYLAKYLSAQGAEIDLYHFKEHDAAVSVEDLFGEAVSRINFIELQFPEKGKLPLHYLRESKVYSQRVFNEFIKRPLPDIIICKGFSGFEFVRKKKMGVQLPPVCINFHGYEMFQQVFSFREKLIRKFLRKPVKYISLNADYCFSYGGKINRLLVEKVGVKKDRILEFPSGIESSKIAGLKVETGSVVRFCFIGRNERRKGIPELNIALRNIEDTEGWSFDFIGPIPEELKVISSKIIYHGLITDQNRIFEKISNCDVLVCPSWSEGMPNVILEAMARGLCVVGTDTGATSLLVNDNTGWLLGSADPEKLTACLRNILKSDRQLITDKRKCAAEHIAANFTWEQIASRIQKKLCEIVGT
jgi:glycosyltransferase involved in cell wall biosynthesis